MPKTLTRPFLASIIAIINATQRTPRGRYKQPLRRLFAHFWTNDAERMDRVSSNLGSTSFHPSSWKKKDLSFSPFLSALGFDLQRCFVRVSKISTQSSFRDDDREAKAKAEGPLLQVLIVRIYPSWKPELPSAYLVTSLPRDCIEFTRQHDRKHRIHESVIHCFLGPKHDFDRSDPRHSEVLLYASL